MVLRPEDIEQREFGSALRGFDKAEVRAFLRRVAGEVRYLESEVEAVRGGSSSGGVGDRPVADLELPRVETRPAPPALAPRLDDLPPRDLPDLGAPGSQLPEPVVSPAAPPHEPEADRFGVLGDRIANLLRNAQETAEQVRRQADSEAAQTRAEAAAAGVELRSSADVYATQTREAAKAEADELRSSADTYAVDVRSSADADADAMRAAAQEALANAQAEASEIREHALADANELRTRAAEELEHARTEASRTLSEAQTEAISLRQQAIDEGVASLAGREQAVTQHEAEVAAEREKAMAELADARGQVSTLLQEARAQSEFIRQESEEIIRTKVRANMEQAQRRIDMLRTTETASKDRIAAARKELESALARLEAEPAPGLPAGTEDLVLEEAQHAALGDQWSPAPALAEMPDRFVDTEVIETGFADPGFGDPGSDAAGFGDSDPADTAFGDTGFGDTESADVAASDTVFTDVSISDAHSVDPSFVDAGAEAADVFESVADSDDGLSAETVIESLGGTADDTPPQRGAFGYDDAIPTFEFGEGVDAAAVDPTMVDLPEPEAVTPPPPPPGFGTGIADPSAGQRVHGGSFFAPRVDEGDVPQTIDEVGMSPTPPGFDTPIGIDAPVFETEAIDEPSAPSDVDPLAGLIPDDVEGAPTIEAGAAPAHGEEQAGPAPQSATESVADINTPENEDALAKLVREAMQRAVDSARGSRN